jgi:D-alanyl-D-alanine carboxypeptidase
MALAIEFYIVLRLLLGAPLDTLVTRDQGLPAWYAPGGNEAAIAALEEMQLVADSQGVKLWVNSSYRDYAYQQEVIRRQASNQPERYRSYSAAPGHSEHQLGTAFDVAWAGLPVESLDGRNLELFQWLEQNAYEFGFVISYPYKEVPEWPFHNRWLPVVTEYIHEPWHIRFVGEALARKMWEQGYLDPQSPILPQDYYHPWP